MVEKVSNEASTSANAAKSSLEEIQSGDTSESSDKDKNENNNKGMNKPIETIDLSEEFKSSNNEFETDLQNFIENVSFNLLQAKITIIRYNCHKY